MKVECVYCGGTGILEDGSNCTRCSSIAKKTIKNHKYIPEYMQDLNYIDGIGGDNERTIKDMINKFHKSTNYIIKFKNNYALAEIIIASLLKELVKNGKSILPIITQLQLDAFTKSVAYSNDLVLSKENTITKDTIDLSDVIVIILNSKLTPYEENNLEKLIGHFNINNRGLVIVTNAENFIKMDKTNNRKVYMDIG